MFFKAVPIGYLAPVITKLTYESTFKGSMNDLKNKQPKRLQ